MRLDGAVALVTGASSGIGAATAAALATAGASLLLSGRDEARLAEVAARTGGTALAGDLAMPGGAAALAERALAAAPAAARGGGVDILVNNAGLGWAGSFGEIPAAKVTELATVNLAAPIELTRLLVPGMAERGRGGVAFVSSIAGVTGVRGEAVYAATKAGLGAFAESLAYEVRGRGVTVSVIVPGVIDTPFFSRRGTPYGRARPAPIPAARVAAAIVSALEHDRAVVYVPGWLRFPAWLHGTAPAAFRALAARFGDPGY
jgi:short-subunit dehydrogenase